MGRETRKIIGPPAWMAGLVEALIPSAHRRFIAGDLRQGYEGPLQFMSFAAKSIAGNVRDQMREAFDIRLVAGEACILYIAFAGAPPAPLTIVLAVTVGAFLLRDAYIHPAEGSAREAATDVTAGAMFILLSQAFIQFAAPPLALSVWDMARGTVVGMVMVSGWRMVFRMKTPQDPRRQQLEEAYKMTWQINVLWMLAVMVLMVSNLNEAVPASRPGRDFWLVLLPIAAFGMAHWSRENRDVPLGKARPFASLGLRSDPYMDELRLKRARLWRPARPARWLSWVACLEGLSLFLVAFPFLIAFGWWVSDDPAAARVNWRPWWTNLAAFVTLLALWVTIRRLNEKVALSLEEEIDVTLTRRPSINGPTLSPRREK